MVLHISKTLDSLITAQADFVVEKAKQAIERDGRFSFVLSGGSSPKKLYELLASAAYNKKIEWSKVFFFLGDERYVPLDHKDSNFLMAKQSLFDPLKISKTQLFPVDTSLPPAEGAQAYQKSIETYFGTKTPCFDLVLLGLGDNSHTASLFPYTKVLYEKEALVKEEFIEEVNMYRITLTAPLINKANHIAFLVFGGAKSIAVRHIIEDEKNIEEYPAQLIQPMHGELHWFLDEDAAKDLKQKV